MTREKLHSRVKLVESVAENVLQATPDATHAVSVITMGSAEKTKAEETISKIYSKLPGELARLGIASAQAGDLKKKMNEVRVRVYGKGQWEAVHGKKAASVWSMAVYHKQNIVEVVEGEKMGKALVKAFAHHLLKE